MAAPRFRLVDGRFTCEDRPFFPVGVNYHPSYAGCQYWRNWDQDRIDEDLRAMAEAGLNALRFFVFWADFEPQEGEYDPVLLERLVWLVSRAGQRGIGCVPSLLTLWMNGQVFDLPWRKGRSLFSDEAMVSHAERFAGVIADALAATGNVIAYDLGDEIPHAVGPAVLDHHDVAQWRTRLVAAIGHADPGATVIQANELSTAMSPGPFSLRNTAPLDLSAVHAFATWAPFEIESHRSEKVTHLVPFLVRLARAFGATMVDELGCYGASESITAGYLSAVLPSAAANGAVGLFVWCWQDVASTAAPYALRPGERLVGLRRFDGEAKAAMASLVDFAAGAEAIWSAVRPVAGSVALYVPEHFGNRADSYLDVSPDWSGLFYAYLLLKRAHLLFEVTTEPSAEHRLVICPSIPHITQPDLDRLSAYCRDGGVVYYSPGAYLNGFGGEDLFGVQLEDFTRDPADHAWFEWDGHRYQMPTDNRGLAIPQIGSAGAKVLAAFPDGSPALTEHAVGRGRAVYLNAPFEAGLNRPGRMSGQEWEALYTSLASLAGIEPLIGCDHPEVEVQPVWRGEELLAVVVNHGQRPVACVVSFRDATGTVSRGVTIGAKDAEVVTHPVDPATRRCP